MKRPANLQALIDDLASQHAAMGVLIDALRMPPEGIDHVLLLQYVVMQSGGKVAEWANGEGLRLPGAKGERRYTGADVLALLDAPGVAAPEPLRELARLVRAKNWGIVLRQFG